MKQQKKLTLPRHRNTKQKTKLINTMKFVKIIAIAAAAVGIALSTSCGSCGSSPEPAPVPVMPSK